MTDYLNKITPVFGSRLNSTLDTIRADIDDVRNNGAVGKSTYQIWLDEGNTGTEQDFLDSLVGPAGSSDLSGTDGATQVGYAADVNSPRTVAAVLGDLPVNPVNFYRSADSGDYGPALARAYAVSKNIVWPTGTFTVNTPLTYSDNNFTMSGANLTNTNATGGTTINAPNGLLVNNNTTRKRITIKNLYVHGSGDGVAIKGPFGGWIEGCRFDNYDTAIENASAYLLHVIRCSFSNCASFGLNVADFNGSEVVGCHFEATVKCHISLVDITPLSGTNNGAPFLLQSNNHNVSGNVFTNNSSLKLRGLFELTNCYFEDYSSGASGNTFVEIQVGQFDKHCLTIRNNLFNGQGYASNGLCIYGSTALRCDTNGSIEGNHFQGFTNADILYGKIADGTNNVVNGLRIGPNTFTAGIVNQNATYVYRPMAHGRSTSTISIAGGTPVTLQIGNTEVYDNANRLSSTTYTIPKDGFYKITANLTCQSTANSYPNITAGIYVNGSSVDLAGCSINFQSNPTSAAVALETTTRLVYGNTVQVKAFNGDLVKYTSFSIQWMGDDNT